MFDHTISYTNNLGVPVTETWTFGISVSEIAEMKLAHRKDLTEYFDAIIAVEDTRELIMLYKALIKEGVGVRRGKHFVKARENEEVFHDFFSTPAYNELFVELIQSKDQGVKFLSDMFPTEYIKAWEEKNKTKEYSDEELLNMSNRQFREVAGPPQEMSRHMHDIAMRRADMKRQQRNGQKPKLKGRVTKVAS